MIGFRTSRAVVIGIDAYQNGIPPLRTAVNDARRVAGTLESDFGYAVRLLVEDVALERLRALFGETLPQEVEADDRLLVYFAGHGIALDGDDGPAGYLVPQDARREDRGTFLPMTELAACLDRLPCRHLLLVLDCCFAGAFRWSSTRDLGALPEVIHRERFERYIRDPAWQVLTSAAYDQKALDVLSGETIGLRGRDLGQAEHSPFAAALLRALQGEADLVPRPRNGRPGGDGVITATELYLYLRECVEVGAESGGHRQTPGLWPLKRHDKGEFIHLVPGHELNLPPAPDLNEENNPYRGLQSYDEEHAPLFFGRSKFVATLAERVRAQSLTIVLGASGTGKSSVVKAGLLSLLRSCEPDAWQVLPPIRPGKLPLAALAAVSLPGEMGDADAIVGRLEAASSDPEALARRVATWAAATSAERSQSARLLHVVDQFEELLTLCWEAAERERFLIQLDRALAACPDRLRVVLTLRSDFEPQFAHSPLQEEWLAARIVVPAMTLDEYREAIEGPASVKVLYYQGKDSSQAFINRLIGDVANTPGALPLLSFTLSELYRRYLAHGGYDRSLSETDYDALGGVGGSLRNRADEVYDNLPDDAHRATVKRVMLRMVSVEGGELARRRVPDLELVYEQPDETARVEEVLRRLTDARLVVEGTDEDEHPYVEPAHDELIRGWWRLLEWSRDGLEELQLRRRLTPAATEWSGGRGGLWIIEPRLGILKFLLKQPEGWLNAVESRFVRRSLAERRNAILGICGATTVLVGLLLIAGWFTYRYFRNLPNERLNIAWHTLEDLGFVVTNENGESYDVLWNAQEQGPLTIEKWRDAAGPLGVLDHYREIASLQLIFTKVADLQPLAGLRKVKHLKIIGSEADELSPIREMDRLEILELSDFRRIEDDDLKVLRSFKSLTSLGLTGCSSLTDQTTEYLAGLPIRNLILSDCGKIDNQGLDSLRGLPLQILMINGTGARVDRRLTDLLLSFPQLVSVNVGGLPADAEELSRLRMLGDSRGLQVSPTSTSVIRGPRRLRTSSAVVPQVPSQGEKSVPPPGRSPAERFQPRPDSRSVVPSNGESAP